MPNTTAAAIAAVMPLRRSARLAALQERRRESEENALRQQRERIAQTHRYVSSTPTEDEVRNVVDVHRSVAVENFLHLARVPTTNVSTLNTNRHRRQRQTARMSTGGRFPNRAMRATGSSAHAAAAAAAASRNLNNQQQQRNNGDRPLFVYDTQELRDSVFNIGIILGNRYSSDSEESYYQPRIIDPNEISEDESEEEASTPAAPVIVRELTPPSNPEPIVRRPVTRSMSSRPGFYGDNPSSSTAAPPPLRRLPPAIKKKDPKKSLCTCKAGTSNVKTVIKVEKIVPCTICFEDEPKKPVACTYCRQTIGCRHCVKKWFLTTNMSHLDQRTPYPVGGTDRNHRRCPLCRAEWMDVPQVVSVMQSL